MSKEKAKPCPFCGHAKEGNLIDHRSGCYLRLLVDAVQDGRAEYSSGVYYKSWNTRHADKELVKALEEICGTTCVDGYGKVIEIADAALGKYKGV
jgi:hypothetical protein